MTEHMFDQWKFAYSVVMARGVDDRNEMLRMMPAMQDFSMIVGRANAAAEGVAVGKPLDDIDRDALNGLARLLREAAAAAEFFETKGASAAPSAALSGSVDIALDTLEAVGGGDPNELNETLTKLAASVDQFSADGKALQAETLQPVFEGLGRRIRSRLGTVGETVSRV